MTKRKKQKVYPQLPSELAAKLQAIIAREEAKRANNN